MGAEQEATDTTTSTLEAFADTIIPGVKRSPSDRAIAGVSDTPGAVAGGALELLYTPATGITAGLESLAEMLNGHADAYADEVGAALDDNVPAFVALGYADRAALVRRLTTPGHPEKAGWVSLAMYCNMAYDSAAHVHTADAIADGHPGLTAMGLEPPDADDKWRFGNDATYGLPLADIHPETTASGSLP